MARTTTAAPRHAFTKRNVRWVLEAAVAMMKDAFDTECEVGIDGQLCEYISADTNVDELLQRFDSQTMNYLRVSVAAHGDNDDDVEWVDVFSISFVTGMLTVELELFETCDGILEPLGVLLENLQTSGGRKFIVTADDVVDEGIFYFGYTGAEYAYCAICGSNTTMNLKRHL